MIKKIISIVLSVILVSACTEGTMKKAPIGTIAGTLAGTAIGTQIGKKGSTTRTVGIVLGALGGAAVGHVIGSGMDEEDQRRHASTSHTALETLKSGQASAWNNPDSGASGTVTPMNTYQQDGRYCREYRQEVTIGGKVEEGYGKACRQPDGSWQIVDK